MSYLYNKNDKATRILPFVQLRLSIENKLKVVIFIARWSVCFVRPKWREVERPTGAINYKNTTRTITIAELSVFETLSLEIFGSISLRATLHY